MSDVRIGQWLAAGLPVSDAEKNIDAHAEHARLVAEKFGTSTLAPGHACDVFADQGLVVISLDLIPPHYHYLRVVTVLDDGEIVLSETLQWFRDETEKGVKTRFRIDAFKEGQWITRVDSWMSELKRRETSRGENA